ncbi:MAG: BPL-N domain-containing protein [Candidatus Krumholzibacteriales bacterium]
MKFKTIKSVSAVLLLLVLMPACQQPEKPVSESGGDGLIRAGVFNGRGASATCVLETIEALKIDPGIEPFEISAAEMMADSLRNVDVMVFPGGSGSTQNNSMGAMLGDMVKDFVIRGGKGVVGICAGAYLISDSEDYPCLRLISAGAVDIEHDKRGSAVVEMKFTDEGIAVFPEMSGHNPGYIQYHDGPLLVPAEGASGTPLLIHGNYLSDVHCSPDAPSGMTPGKIFLASQEVGEGRVFACAGHPESTRGMRWLVPRMVRWVAGEKQVSYGNDVVRPQIGKREIMHDDAVEKELFWNLFDDNPKVRINALVTLVELRHRNGFRWAVGMLRDRDPEVRSKAAMVLAGSEYTAALDDLEVAIEREGHSRCREILEESLQRLKSMRGE